MRSGLEVPHIPRSLVRVGTGPLQTTVGKSGVKKDEVPYIPFSLIVGSLKRGYLLKYRLIASQVTALVLWGTFHSSKRVAGKAARANIAPVGPITV